MLNKGRGGNEGGSPAFWGRAGAAFNGFKPQNSKNLMLRGAGVKFLNLLFFFEAEEPGKHVF